MQNEVSRVKKAITVIIFGLIGQALCWITMNVGFAITTEIIALIIHAILAPVFFFMVSVIYFKKFNYTTPIITAIIFISIVVSMDFFIVALLIEQSFDMFLSPIGTWAPFTMIFLSTLITGKLINR
ncbi:MAG: hypothetical protein KGD61_01900 [Candidatus Lokiarchaeota archaeon]|nr:hypothetical protein [Candidatus Lokiarchaeota archaeon]